MENPVKIFTSNQIFEIELLKAKLEDNNIETYIINKQDSAYVVIGEAELYVDEADAEKARKFVKQQDE